MIDGKKQWFFLSLISLWILISTIGPIVAFCLTNNPLSLSLMSTLAPPLYILYRIARSLFPLNDGDIQIALAKAQYTEKKQPGKPPRKTSVHLLSIATDKTPDTKT